MYYKKTIAILLACLSASSFAELDNTPIATDKPDKVMYESPEHYLLGSAIRLKFIDSQIAGDQAIVYDNLSFAQIVYLAGDFMGDPNVQIGDSTSSVNQQDFIKNFNVMGTYPASTYIPKIIELVNKQISDNKNNIINGKELNIPEQSNIDMNCATGGGCSKATWLFDYGLYMKLAQNNYDHFGLDAINSYLAGHTIALGSAKLANETNDPVKKKLFQKNAYAYEAYADHFLSDLYASGHLRTPRRELVNWCTGADLISPGIPGFLAKVMHDEDNKNGLYVTLNNKSSFKAFGDKELFINDNSDGMNKAILAMQNSADQIYDVSTGRITVSAALQAANGWLPDLGKISSEPKNSPALFKVNGNEMMHYSKEKKRYEVLDNCITTAIAYGFEML